MYLYLVTNPDGGGYDEFDSFVVATRSPERAKLYNPSGKLYPFGNWNQSGAWAETPDKIKVTFLGVAATNLSEGEVVITSFNAA